MAHIVMFPALAFQKVKLDKDGNRTIEPDGPEEVVTKGNLVPDYVPEWQLGAFTQAGMIVPVADRQPAPEPVEVGPVAPVNAENPPAPLQAVVPPASSSPKETDNRAAWEAYATSNHVGMTTDEAASYPNKGALIDAVNARTEAK